ncbi:DUF882 domain-containing protein [Candidatus Binatia bacterium]|nr:DUF882 domain-containing protein [Candidatus Binatia bacterium]
MNRPILAAMVTLAVAAGTACAHPPHASTSPRPHALTPPRPPRFFVHGDGRLRLRHAHFNSVLDVRYRRPDGTYDPAALAEIRHFFRSRGDGREGRISLRLIELLGYVQTHYRPRTMTLVSGYRSPDYNEGIRSAGALAAQTSLHTQGLAADVAMTGVNLKRLWTDLRAEQVGGAGYYRSGNFLHLDTGPPRFWEETTSRVKDNLSADNARVFVRTDFDYYDRLDGARVELHSVTAFPLAIRREASVGGTQVVLEAADNTPATRRGDCLVIDAPADAYVFNVRSADGHGSAGKAPLVLTTCAPRTGKTKAELVSNPIEAER